MQRKLEVHFSLSDGFRPLCCHMKKNFLRKVWLIGIFYTTEEVKYLEFVLWWNLDMCLFYWTMIFLQCPSPRNTKALIAFCIKGCNSCNRFLLLGNWGFDSWKMPVSPWAGHLASLGQIFLCEMRKWVPAKLSGFVLFRCWLNTVSVLTIGWWFLQQTQKWLELPLSMNVLSEPGAHRPFTSVSWMKVEPEGNSQLCLNPHIQDIAWAMLPLCFTPAQGEEAEIYQALPSVSLSVCGNQPKVNEIGTEMIVHGELAMCMA